MSIAPTSMLPNFDQVLTYGWTMLLAYAVLLGWTVVFGLHVVRPARRDVTKKILWTFCLLTPAVALLHGNFHEMRIHRMVLSTYGSLDPLIYATEIYLGRAGACLLAGVAMVQAVLTGWASFLVKPSALPGESPAAEDYRNE